MIDHPIKKAAEVGTKATFQDKQNDSTPGDLVQASIEGRNCAEKFILDLSTMLPVGDDLYHVINHHTAKLDDKEDAFMRGFCRRIQKFCEVHV